MKRTICVLLAMATVAAMGVGVASATTHSYPTKITHDGTADLGHGKFLFSGQVLSRREVCQMNRIVKLVAHFPNGRTQLLDLDSTSDAGAWALKAVDIRGADRLKAKALVGKYERRYPSPPPGVVCKAAAVVWRLA
ncbi:MAG: hypothetical protein ACRDK1_06130 [Solirubrobacterales bacterium]